MANLRKIDCLRLACCALALLPAGCWLRNGFKVGPNYEPPPALVAEDWIDSIDERVLPVPPPHPEWWSAFEDPKLDELIGIAYEQNLTLREAGTRILQARAVRGIAAGNLLPQVQRAFGDYLHVQLSRNLDFRPPGLPRGLPFLPRTFDNWGVGFNAAWELDVWGKFRRAVEAADANLDASVFAYDAILVSLIAEVAAAYVEYRTFEQRLAYARDNVEIQEGSLAQAKKKAEKSKLADVGVHLAKSNLDETQAVIPRLETGKRIAQNRLCTLLGMPPADLSACLGAGPVPAVPLEITVGIPADLLRRRPDVRAAERIVAEKSALIGVAVSELFPSIGIGGEIGFDARTFDILFSPGSNSGVITPFFSWNILNYGRIVNNVRVQDARLLEAILRFQNRVLDANREVEDALVHFLNTQQEVTKLADAVRENQAALKLLLEDYEKLNIPFAPIFLLQAVLRANQDRLAAAEGELALAMIGVYKALGGGWEIRCRDEAIEPGVQELPGEEELPLPRSVKEEEATQE